MKKYMYVGIIIQVLVMTFIFISIKDKLELSDLLYKGKTKVLMLQDNLSEEEFIKLRDLGSRGRTETVLKLAEENGIEISKYIFADNDKLTIYTSDLLEKGRVKWKDKKFREKLEKKEIKEMEVCSGEDFVWSNKNVKVKIKDFMQSERTEILGVHYLKVNELEKLGKFISEVKDKLKETVRCESRNEYYTNVLEDILGKYYLILTWLILFIVNISIMMQYLVKSSNKISILKISGWKNKEILHNYMISCIKIANIASIVSFILITGYFYIFYGGFILAKVYIMMLIFNGISMLVVYLILCKIVILIVKKENEKVKGKRCNGIGIGINIVSKLCIAMVAVLLGISTIETKKEIDQRRSQEKYWDNTKDVYMLRLRFITNDYKKYRPFAIREKIFYDRVVKEKGAFLIDVNNYVLCITGSENNSRVPLYKLNTHSELEELVSPLGKSIVVNKNYLSRHRVVDEKEENVVKRLIYKDNVMNILVPVKLKKYEKEIREKYLCKFDFMKNLFVEDFGLEEMKDLKLNLIYVKDNHKYFTYSDDLTQEEDFTIIDPVVIVETGNFDPTHYSHFLTSATYVESKKEDGYNYLLSDVIETGLDGVIQGSVSIYNFRAEELNRREILFNTLVVIELLLIGIFIYNIYLSYELILERYKYSIYIKKIFGYRYIELFLGIVMSQILLSFVVGSLLLYEKYSELTRILVIGWWIFEILVTIITLLSLKEKIVDFSVSKRGDIHD